MVARQSAEEIEQEAARWVLRLDYDGADPSLNADLTVWLEQDSRRQGAFLLAQSAWLSLDTARGSAEPHNRDERVDLVIAIGSDRARWHRHVSRRRLLVGAGAIAATGLSFAVLPKGGDLYETQRGELRRVALADRSIATINTGSRLEVSLKESRRDILLDRGEAWFQVAHDNARPFTVAAGSVRVQAVGTAFSVRRREEAQGGGVEVLVTEGVVRVWTVGDESEAIRARAGERAFVAGDKPTPTLEASSLDITRSLAWRSGRIDLSGETLGQAVQEFNRYNQTRLVVADPIIAAKPLFGVFRLDDPEGFARTAAAAFRTGLYDDGTSTLVIGNIRKKNITNS